MVKVLFSWLIALTACAHLRATGWAVEQSVTVKAGWSAFWLGVDVGAEKGPEDFFSGLPVTSVACFRPDSIARADMYATTPASETLPVQPYSVWHPDEPTSTLTMLPADAIYIVKATEACSVRFTGKPVLRRMQWFDSSRGVNLFGVSTSHTGGLAPENYLKGFPNYNGSISFIGGAGDAPILVPALTGILRVAHGNVLAVANAPVSDWCGDFAVTSTPEIVFGSQSSQAEVHIANTSGVQQTLTIALRDHTGSAAAPAFSLSYREGTTAEQEAFSGTISRTLKANETWSFTLALDRTTLAGSGELLCAVLEVTTDAPSGHLERLPVSTLDVAADASDWPPGIWLVSGELDRVAHLYSYWEGETRKTVSVDGLKAPSMPVFFILKSDGSTCELLQHLTVGLLEGKQKLYGPTVVPPNTLQSPVRTSCVLLPVDVPTVPLTADGAGSSRTATWTLAPDSPSNPFRHPYHPDHDGKRADFTSPAPSGDELGNYAEPVKPEVWSVFNTLSFTRVLPPGEAVQSDTRSGTLQWTMGNLRAEGDIRVTGTFTATRVHPDLSDFNR